MQPPYAKKGTDCANPNTIPRTLERTCAERCGAARACIIMIIIIIFITVMILTFWYSATKYSSFLRLATVLMLEMASTASLEASCSAFFSTLS